MLGHNKQVNTDSQHNGGAESDTLAAFCRNKEADECQQTNNHTGHDGKQDEEHRPATDEEGNDNLAEFSSDGVCFFGFDHHAPQRPVTVLCGEFEF